MKDLCLKGLSLRIELCHKKQRFLRDVSRKKASPFRSSVMATSVQWTRAMVDLMSILWKKFRHWCCRCVISFLFSGSYNVSKLRLGDTSRLLFASGLANTILARINLLWTNTIFYWSVRGEENCYNIDTCTLYSAKPVEAKRHWKGCVIRKFFPHLTPIDVLSSKYFLFHDLL